MRVNLWNDGWRVWFLGKGLKTKTETRKSQQHTFTTESKRQKFLVLNEKLKAKRELTGIELSRIVFRSRGSRCDTSAVFFDRCCVYCILPFKIATATSYNRSTGYGRGMIVIRCVTWAWCYACKTIIFFLIILILLIIQFFKILITNNSKLLDWPLNFEFLPPGSFPIL